MNQAIATQDQVSPRQSVGHEIGDFKIDLWMPRAVQRDQFFDDIYADDPDLRKVECWKPIEVTAPGVKQRSGRKLPYQPFEIRLKQRGACNRRAGARNALALALQLSRKDARESLLPDNLSGVGCCGTKPAIMQVAQHRVSRSAHGGQHALFLFWHEIPRSP
jgi:hypothetical protein